MQWFVYAFINVYLLLYLRFSKSHMSCILNLIIQLMVISNVVGDLYTDHVSITILADGLSNIIIKA